MELSILSLFKLSLNNHAGDRDRSLFSFSFFLFFSAKCLRKNTQNSVTKSSYTFIRTIIMSLTLVC